MNTWSAVPALLFSLFLVMEVSNLDMAKTRTDLDPRLLGTTAAGEDSDVWQGFALTKHRCCSVLTKPCSFLGRMAAAPDLQTSHQDFSPHWNYTSIRSAGRAWVNSGSQLFCTLFPSILPRKEFRLFVLLKKCHSLRHQGTHFSWTRAQVHEGLWGYPKAALILLAANTHLGNLHMDRKCPHTSAIQRISFQSITRKPKFFWLYGVKYRFSFASCILHQKRVHLKISQITKYIN